MCTIDKLVKFLENHGVEAWTVNGKLLAYDEYTLGTDDKGKSIWHREVTEIQPTVKAVKKFLNY